MKSEKLKYSKITYIFSNDDFILRLNQQYLRHNFFTDILTFTLSMPDEPVVSEIYISIDRVKENAEKFQSSFEKELYRVLVHGLLHLVGYNDHTAVEKKRMRQKEDYYINKTIWRFTWNNKVNWLQSNYYVSRGTDYYGHHSLQSPL